MIKIKWTIYIQKMLKDIIVSRRFQEAIELQLIQLYKIVLLFTI